MNVQIPKGATQLVNGSNVYNWSFFKKNEEGVGLFHMLDSRGWFPSRMTSTDERYTDLPLESTEVLSKHFNQESNTFQCYEIPEGSLFANYDPEGDPDFYSIVNGEIMYYCTLEGEGIWRCPIDLIDFQKSTRLPIGDL